MTLNEKTAPYEPTAIGYKEQSHLIIFGQITFPQITVTA